MLRRREMMRPKAHKCYFCQEKTEPSWSKPEILGKFVSDRGRIFSKGRTGLCARHQRRLTVGIKKARHLALLPFVTQAK